MIVSSLGSFVFLFSSSAAVVPSAELSPPPVWQVSTSHFVDQSSQQIQLADEITRRLRKMGINIMKTRLDRPYDGDGELC